MAEEILKEQDASNKKNKWKQFKPTKKFWKWTLGSLALILFGTSAVLNIAYVPKYFALKNHQEANLNISIAAFDETNNNQLLLALTYQSSAATLGDLMTTDSKTYTLSAPGLYGRLLIAVTYQDKTLTASDADHTFWEIHYNGAPADFGIDSLYLNNYDKIELHYKTW